MMRVLLSLLKFPQLVNLGKNVTRMWEDSFKKVFGWVYSLRYLAFYLINSNAAQMTDNQ